MGILRGAQVGLTGQIFCMEVYMWLFCTDGFFSAVENRNNSKEVIIRARSVSDVQTLSKVLGVPWNESDALADYPFRLTCSKTQWAKYLSEAANSIDYDNFKSAMEKSFDVSRMSQLHDVWRTMQRTPFDDYDFRGSWTGE
jgi:hypothetical protein